MVSIETERFREGARALGLAALLATLAAQPTSAQDFQGRVLDAARGTPIPGAVVEIRGQALVTMTDSAGVFSFSSVDDVTDSVSVSRYGYVTQSALIDFDSLARRTFELEVDPVMLEGISTALSFAERMTILNGNLDMRVGEWPGTARVADTGDLRTWDEEWKSDPYAFLYHGPLEVGWQFNSDPATQEDRVWVRGYGQVTPEVWIDDRQVWLQVLLETPNESLCRVETYMPDRYTLEVQPTPQIRAYTCPFMARAALGMEKVCPVLQWGRLISGPGDQTGGLALNPRRDLERPTGALTPIDLGPGLDLSSAAIGVGSGACR